MKIALVHKGASQGVGPSTYRKALEEALGDAVSWCTPKTIPPDADLIHVLDQKAIPETDWQSLVRSGRPMTVELHDAYFLENPDFPTPDRLLRKMRHRNRRRLVERLAKRPLLTWITHARTICDTLPHPSVYIPLALPSCIWEIERRPTLHPTLCFVGKDRFRKGFGTLIDAHLLLRRRWPDLEIHVIGTDYLHGEGFFRLRAMGRRIVFHGPMPHEETWRRMASSWAVVLPSYQEAIPHVMLEALALGVPFIGSDIGGMKEVFARAAVGWKVAARDPHALATTIQTVLEHGKAVSDYASTGRAYVTKHHTTTLLRNNLSALWEGLCEDLR
jgi:glycosyltransferase involved in cell wall biosynthesis